MTPTTYERLAKYTRCGAVYHLRVRSNLQTVVCGRFCAVPILSREVTYVLVSKPKAYDHHLSVRGDTITPYTVVAAILFLLLSDG